MAGHVKRIFIVFEKKPFFDTELLVQRINELEGDKLRPVKIPLPISEEADDMALTLAVYYTSDDDRIVLCIIGDQEKFDRNLNRLKNLLEDSRYTTDFTMYIAAFADGQQTESLLGGVFYSAAARSAKIERFSIDAQA